MTAVVRRPRNRGFSLLETVIVLSVISVLFGGIWIAAVSAREHVRLQNAIEAIDATVANMRHYYAGQSGMPGSPVQTLVPLLLNANIIPANLLRPVPNTTCANDPGAPGGLCADTPWGAYNAGTINANGTFRACSWIYGQTDCAASPAAGSPFFGISLLGLTQASCIGLVEAISGAQGPAGLIEVDINDANMLQKSGASITPTPINPVPPDAATANCQRYANGGAVVRFAYRLSTPTP